MRGVRCEGSHLEFAVDRFVASLWISMTCLARFFVTVVLRCLPCRLRFQDVSNEKFREVVPADFIQSLKDVQNPDFVDLLLFARYRFRRSADRAEAGHLTMPRGVDILNSDLMYIDVCMSMCRQICIYAYMYMSISIYTCI